MLKIPLLFILLITISSDFVFAQRDTQLGSSSELSGWGRQGGFFDYSDPEAVNIKVSVWGFVNYPGKYIIPSYSTVSDLISYAGGPTEDSELDELRLYRVNEDGSEQLLKFSYDDLLWDSDLEKDRRVPSIQPSDVLVVPGSRRLYFNDWLSIGLSIFSALVSLTILIRGFN